MVNYPYSAPRISSNLPDSARRPEGDFRHAVFQALEQAEDRIVKLEALAHAAQTTDTRMVDEFLVFLKQVKPDVVRDFHIWLEAKKKVIG